MARRPAQYCPVARTLDLIGDRWTMLILRDLLLDGPCKFQDLQELTRRRQSEHVVGPTQELMQSGIVERRLYAEHPPRAEYLLTSKGRELRPVLRALREWGETHTG